MVEMLVKPLKSETISLFYCNSPDIRWFSLIPGVLESSWRALSDETLLTSVSLILTKLHLLKDNNTDIHLAQENRCTECYRRAAIKVSGVSESSHQELSNEPLLTLVASTVATLQTFSQKINKSE